MKLAPHTADQEQMWPKIVPGRKRCPLVRGSDKGSFIVLLGSLVLLALCTQQQLLLQLHFQLVQSGLVQSGPSGLVQSTWSGPVHLVWSDPVWSGPVRSVWSGPVHLVWSSLVQSGPSGPAWSGSVHLVWVLKRTPTKTCITFCM